MDALDALRNKRDTRTYLDEPVDDAVLARVLDAARMAGSAKNVQPVRLVVVTEQGTKEALKASGDFATWIDQAPVLVVVTVRGDAGPRAMFDVGRHAQNLMIAGFAEGLSSCPVTIHHPDVVREVLAIPGDIDPAMIVSLGVPQPGEKPPAAIASPRVPLSEYAARDSWSG